MRLLTFTMKTLCIAILVMKTYTEASDPYGIFNGSQTPTYDYLQPPSPQPHRPPPRQSSQSIQKPQYPSIVPSNPNPLSQGPQSTQPQRPSIPFQPQIREPQLFPYPQPQFRNYYPEDYQGPESAPPNQRLHFWRPPIPGKPEQLLRNPEKIAEETKQQLEEKEKLKHLGKFRKPTDDNDYDSIA